MDTNKDWQTENACSSHIVAAYYGRELAMPSLLVLFIGWAHLSWSPCPQGAHTCYMLHMGAHVMLDLKMCLNVRDPILTKDPPCKKGWCSCFHVPHAWRCSCAQKTAILWWRSCLLPFNTQAGKWFFLPKMSSEVWQRCSLSDQARTILSWKDNNRVSASPQCPQYGLASSSAMV